MFVVYDNCLVCLWGLNFWHCNSVMISIDKERKERFHGISLMRVLEISFLCIISIIWSVIIDLISSFNSLFVVLLICAWQWVNDGHFSGLNPKCSWLQALLRIGSPSVVVALYFWICERHCKKKSRNRFSSLSDCVSNYMDVVIKAMLVLLFKFARVNSKTWLSCLFWPNCLLVWSATGE